MHQVLLNKIVRSVKETTREPLLPESEIEIRGDKFSIPERSLLTWARQKLAMTPWFIEDDQGNIKTPLESVFGLFTLRAVFRGFFIGVSFLPGSNLLLEKRYLSLAIIGYYTAAYHLIGAFNAIQGRVFMTPIAGRPIVELPSSSSQKKLETGGIVTNYGSAGYNPTPKSLRAVCAKLTDNGKWVYEGRDLTHSTHWHELQQSVTETRNIPIWLDSFCRDCVYPNVPVDENTYLDEGFQQLRYMRHEAMYYGFGIDDYSFDQMANREFGGTSIAAKGNNYKRFAYGILEDILKETTDIYDYIQTKCSDDFTQLLPQLCTMIYSPPFDLRRDFLDQIADTIQKVPNSKEWIARLLAEAQ